MNEKEEEERHLAEADQHIARVRENIRLQRERIERQSAQGLPTDDYEILLRTMLNSLTAMEGHRALILETLADLAKRYPD